MIERVRSLFKEDESDKCEHPDVETFPVGEREIDGEPVIYEGIDVENGTMIYKTPIHREMQCKLCDEKFERLAGWKKYAADLTEVDTEYI